MVVGLALVKGAVKMPDRARAGQGSRQGTIKNSPQSRCFDINYFDVRPDYLNNHDANLIVLSRHFCDVAVDSHKCVPVCHTILTLRSKLDFIASMRGFRRRLRHQ